MKSRRQKRMEDKMRIQFFFKKTNENIPKEVSDGWLFVSCDKVYADNFKTYESQSATISFEDFCKERDDIDWIAVEDTRKDPQHETT